MCFVSKYISCIMMHTTAHKLRYKHTAYAQIDAKHPQQFGKPLPNIFQIN